MSHNNQKRLLTAAEIEVRIWAIVVLAVVFYFGFIIFALIYRTTFVTQPIKQISPMDLADQKMLNDIVLLIVGGIGGIMTRKAVKEAAEMIAAVQKPPTPTFPAPSMVTFPSSYGSGSVPLGNTMSFMQQPAYQTPTQLDNSWVPPPAPTNPPHHLEPDDERERMAAARQTVKDQ